MKTKRSIATWVTIVFGATALLFSASSQAFAQFPRTWTGGGSSNNWTDLDNWGSPPSALIPGSTLIFAGSTQPVTNNSELNSSNSVFNLQFDASAAAFTLGGAQITLSDSSGSAGTISFSGEPGAPITHTIDLNIGLNSNGGTITTRNNGSILVNGVISGSGAVTKSGDGTLTLTGSNSYSGLTTVSAGTLNIQNANALGGTTNGTTVSSSGTLALQNNITVASEALTLGGTLRNVADSNTYSGAITLSGTATVTSDAGSLTLNSATAIGGSGQALTFDGAGNTTVSSNISTDTGSLTKNGSGTLTLTGNNNYSGTTTINSGTLQLGNGSTTGTLATGSAISIGTGGTFAINRSNIVTQGTDFSGSAITGAGGITQAGSGTTVLNADNSYTGTTTVSNGTLNIQHANALGSTTGGTTVSSTGTLALQSTTGITTAAESLTLSGNGFGSGGALRNVSGNNTYSGVITLADHARINSDAGTLTLDVSTANAITAIDRNITFGGSGDIVVADAISTGSGTLTKDGSGKLTLAGSNSYTGTTTISGGTLQVGNGTSGSIANTSSISVASGSTLAVNRTGTLSQADVLGSGAISGAGSFTKLGSGTLTLTANNSYTGGTLVSEGTLIINGNQSAATGAITVESGATLTGTGSYGGSTSDILTVNGTLTGKGTITGNAVINGVHSPGNSPGKQTFTGSLTYNTGSSVNWELISNTTDLGLTAQNDSQYDFIQIGGNLTFSGATSLNLIFNSAGSLVDWNNSFWASNQSWKIYDLTGSSPSITGLNLFTPAGSPWTDGFGNTLASVRSGASFSLNQSGGDVFLSYDFGPTSAIPEPSSWALMSVVGLFGGGRWVRRRFTRRRQKSEPTC